MTYVYSNHVKHEHMETTLVNMQGGWRRVGRHGRRGRPTVKMSLIDCVVPVAIIVWKVLQEGIVFLA